MKAVEDEDNDNEDEQIRPQGWEAVGPAVACRYLRLAGQKVPRKGKRRSPDASQDASSPRALMARLSAMNKTGAFERFLQAITGLSRPAVRQPARVDIRRFRIGDYVRARTVPKVGSMRLDTVLYFGPKRRWRRRGAGDVFVEARKGVERVAGLLDGPEGVLPRAPLMRSAPLANTLQVVLTDPKTEHLVEPVGNLAKGSRWDMAMEMEVEGGDDRSDFGEGELGEEEDRVLSAEESAEDDAASDA